MQTTAAPSIPTPGSPAYWCAQREAFTLFRAFHEHLDDPKRLLPVLRQIAAHGFARRLLAAHSHDADRLLRSFADHIASWAVGEPDEDGGDPDDGPDEPPSGEDWCPRGCQPLFRMDCGMCGHRGRGVWADAVGTVAEYCCHCRARTHQSRGGICERCGKHAEGDDESPPASPPAAGSRDRGCTGAGVGCGSPSCPGGRDRPDAAGARDSEPETAPHGASALDEVP